MATSFRRQRRACRNCCGVWWHRTAVKFPAGVGSRATGLSEVRQSLRDAKVACRQSSRDPEHPVCRYDELDLDLVVAMVPQREKQQLLARVFGEFSPEELAQTMQMLRVYTQFNGSISQAAEALHIHKNSLQYRLNRLAQRTGYVPQNIAHMSYLYLLLLIYDDFHSARQSKHLPGETEKGESN